MANATVCYCFGYTEADIIRDVIDNGGVSTIIERIMAEKREGNCDCAHVNPKGR